jgi:hypothetical protein
VRGACKASTRVGAGKRADWRVESVSGGKKGVEAGWAGGEWFSWVRRKRGILRCGGAFH